MCLTGDHATVWVGRWPRPHHPGEVIHSTDGGRSVFDHHDTAVPGQPVAGYIWVADRVES